MQGAWPEWRGTVGKSLGLGRVREVSRAGKSGNNWAGECVVAATRTWFPANSDPFLRVDYGALQVPQEEGDQPILLRTPGQRLRALPGSQSRQGECSEERLSRALGGQAVLTSSKSMKGLALEWKLHKDKDLVYFVHCCIPSA